MAGVERGRQQPQWRRDGKELFYLSLDNTLMVVEVSPRNTDFTFGPPRALFATNVTSLERESHGMQYAASRDGSRFLVNRRTETPWNHYGGLGPARWF